MKVRLDYSMSTVPVDYTSDEMLAEIYKTFRVESKTASTLSEYHKLLESHPQKKAVLVGSFNARKKSN